MRKYNFVWGLFFLLANITAGAQQPVIDKVKFFEEDKVLKATIVTNVGKILSGRMKDSDSITSSCLFYFNDSNAVSQRISVSVRGKFRRKNCVLPPLKLDFKKAGSAYASLGTLKLVSCCRPIEQYNQYILAEYLIYKMYNLFTEKSFRVRLLELTYRDSAGRKKDIVQNAFLIEDAKDMAKRNNMVEWKNGKIFTEQTNREQMTLVALFEYMIGNTDFSVPITHNIRLIYDKEKQKDRPFPVPYDFDYCGLVDAEYAIPADMFNLENIRQRLYRGYPRTMEELYTVINVFKGKKELLYALINGFNLLKASKKGEMISYLDEFYNILNNSREIESIFIKNARND
jgi:hypothetical protein